MDGDGRDDVDAVAAAQDDDESNNEEEDLLFINCQTLMDKITASALNPNPNVLHALATILETHETRYMENTFDTSVNNVRASHTIGRLGNLIRENDDFFELISSKFLSESRYSISVQAAAVRVLFSCSLTWMYPHVFEENVLDNIKGWVLNDASRSSCEDSNLNNDCGQRKSSDAEMLKTYSTGILALCLAGGGQIVEDVLTSGLSAKLMRYLRIQTLGETSKKDANHSMDSKLASAISVRGKDESRNRIRHVTDNPQLDAPRITEGVVVDQVAERDSDKSFIRPAYQPWMDGGESPDSLADGDDDYGADVEGRDGWHGQDLRDRKTKCGDRNVQGRSMREEDFDDGGGEDSLRRRVNRGGVRSRGRGKINEGVTEAKYGLTSPGTGRGQERRMKDRTLTCNMNSRSTTDVERCFPTVGGEGFSADREDTDDCFEECKIGSKDISDLVKKAVRAAEAEARAAAAPAEAIKAAGESAAEVVKTAALEVYNETNDEEAAVLAASKAASTVIDAGYAVEISRRLRSVETNLTNSQVAEPERNDETEEFSIPDSGALANLRERFCIQCLEVLGEYVEVLGPVLHEKGVDVCIALLQRSSRFPDEPDIVLLLSDVLKLISALAAHRKFAAVFVDRGGMQKLLTVPRVTQTFLGLSSCLFTIGSLQVIMERVCALPSDVVYQLIELALQLLECPQDLARKDAAVFFAAAFVFRAVLDCFDAQDGLQKLLNLLQTATSVRSGVNSGVRGTSPTGSLRNDQSPSEVLTSSEKQVAYHTGIALKQYFRAHLVLLVDSIRPNKTNRSAARNIPSVRAAYKPLDISNEAMDATFRQIQKDRKLGPAFVRARWPAVDKFLALNGHITMLELCQAPPVERYLHDLIQYALSVLHIVTLVPYGRKLLVNATLSNDRVGIAVILDATNGAGYVEPQIIQPALNVLVNLVCPPPSISNKPPLLSHGQQSLVQSSNGPTVEGRDRNAERNMPERSVPITSQIETKERTSDSTVVDRVSTAALGTASANNSSLTPVSAVPSGLVGDRRISLGVGAGCAGLAAQLEQVFHQAREAVRANNGIKVLLQLLQPRVLTPPGALDCLRALACRVLLGLARDDTIAHILTKLQVGKKLSELIRDPGGQSSASEQGRWQAELAQVAIELIAVVTNSGRASTLAATDAATPTLRRIERAAIAAATPITYHSKELLLLIHEHLQASGLGTTAAALLKEAQLTPLPSLAAPSSLSHQASVQETPSIQVHWPSRNTSGGFYCDKNKSVLLDEDSSMKSDMAVSSSKKRSLVFSSTLGLQPKPKSQDSYPAYTSKISNTTKRSGIPAGTPETPSASGVRPGGDQDINLRTPITLPMKRKLSETTDAGRFTSNKRLITNDNGLRNAVCTTPSSVRKLTESSSFSTPCLSKDSHGRLISGGLVPDNLEDSQYNSNLPQATPSVHHGLLNDPQHVNTERLTLNSIVTQYLKNQHRQCPAPITTLPPLSLLHPHVCPESRRSIDVPSNVTARLTTREYRSKYGGIQGSRRDHQFVYSRFRPWRTCRDDSGALMTCMTFLGDSSRIAAGCDSGELKIFDSDNGNMLESCTSHQFALTVLQSHRFEETQLILSSSSHDVRLWDASSVSAGPRHSFEGCKSGKLSNSGRNFGALSLESTHREILLYDVETCNLDLKLTDTNLSISGRSHVYSPVHFSPSDTMLLWNGVLWDRREPEPVYHFDQFTDYGGGGFHPAGNEVIINSEVWDLRKFRLLRSVPSLDQTVVTFNGSGDVIYATLRRNLDDVTSAIHTRRVKHPLYSAFRTVDAVNYSDIATVPVDRCVLDFATEPTDSVVGLVTMDDPDEMYSSARIFEIGRRRPTDDDSDPDDAETEDEDEDDDEDIDEDPLLGIVGDGGSDMDDMSNDDSASELEDEEDDDGEFMMDDQDDDGEMLEFVTGGEDGDEDSQVDETYSSDEDDDDFVGVF
ncbi:hypothetical protein DCAR_0102241 [Daucus carota subsp. sativus]|uniref:LisH domain-containing protein n=1 Tax=Daucus carota subsp. sativus TaxID=79200 RepID=A0AAF0W4V8_DAUCS|nr:PREDICTED: DDB1- and CUL4-associated factor homolog 1 isoform X1 [Daucus carota subsp. sativus]XP_017225050.1 PREDICTED: DDB1- and CUL4-associated factor homolog 1 isoform X2 [Daucus carota subsp. sativus]WOG83067.1 hypothetical protein DCAR_0102241 [Daucus carota subsp. sativus]